MNKRSLIIHIGPHKTGTTYIQKCLVDNRGKLLDVGVFYPEIGQKFYGHHNIVRAIKQKDDALIDSLIKSIPEDIEKVLLSSEVFDELPSNAIKYMMSKFENFNVRVVYFKRDAEPLLFSRWQEVIKHGGVCSWSEYFLGHLAYPYRSAIINQRLVLDKYAEAAKLENIEVINYEKIVQQGDNVVLALLQRCDIQINVDLPSKAENQSMRPAGSEILRALNQLFLNEGKLKVANIRRAFFLTLKDSAVLPIYKELISLVCKYNVPFTLSDAAVIQLQEQQFFNKYQKNGENDGYYSRGKDSRKMPISAWMCDVRVNVLLPLLKSKVEENLNNIENNA